VCRSFNHSTTNNEKPLYKIPLIYERQVGGALSSFPAHDKLRRLLGKALHGEAGLTQVSKLSPRLPVPT